MEKIISDLITALEFYADPATYDDNSEESISNDTSDDHGFGQYPRPMPGKLARVVLRRIKSKGYEFCD